MRMQLALTHGEDTAIGEHRAIAAAARAGDATRAAKLLRAHIKGAGHRLIQFLRVQRDGVVAVAAPEQSGRK